MQGPFQQGTTEQAAHAKIIGRDQPVNYRLDGFGFGIGKKQPALLWVGR
jgi:hypothetical protein